MAQIIGIQPVVKILLKKGKVVPQTITELNDFPYSSYVEFKNAIQTKEAIMSRHAAPIYDLIEDLIESPDRKFIINTGIMLFPISLLLCFIGTVFISYWSIFLIIASIFIFKKNKELYNNLIYNSCLNSESEFCFLYFSRQISVTSTSKKKTYFMTKEQVSKMFVDNKKAKADDFHFFAELEKHADLLRLKLTSFNAVSGKLKSFKNVEDYNIAWQIYTEVYCFGLVTILVSMNNPKFFQHNNFNNLFEKFKLNIKVKLTKFIKDHKLKKTEIEESLRDKLDLQLECTLDGIALFMKSNATSSEFPALPLINSFVNTILVGNSEGMTAIKKLLSILLVKDILKQSDLFDIEIANTYSDAA